MMNDFGFSPQCIVYDFDGVMTDNRVILDENGNESVCVHRGDGYGVRMIKDRLQISQMILSTEVNPLVVRRAEKLKIPVIYRAGDGKADMLRKFADKNGFQLQKILYIGNDINDLDAMLLCGYKACPFDAEPEIKSVCDYIFQSCGGYGVIRELYRLLSEKCNE